MVRGLEAVERKKECVIRSPVKPLVTERGIGELELVGLLVESDGNENQRVTRDDAQNDAGVLFTTKEKCNCKCW